MTKKEANLLGLTPFPQVVSNGLILYSPGSALSNTPTKAEQRIVVDTQRQVLVIRSQREKADTATHEISQIHQQGAQEFLEIASHLSQVKAQAQGKDFQSLVEEFAQRSAQLAAQHLFGVMEVSARNIGMEAARPLYRDEEPEVEKSVQKPGLLRRLLGD